MQGGTADIFDVITGKASKIDEFCIKNEEFCIKNEGFCVNNDEFLQVTTVKLKGGSRKKCAATAVVLARDTDGNPTEGKILIGGGYRSVAVDIWDLQSGTWSVSKVRQPKATSSRSDTAVYSSND